MYISPKSHFGDRFLEVIPPSITAIYIVMEIVVIASYVCSYITSSQHLYVLHLHWKSTEELYIGWLLYSDEVNVWIVHSVHMYIYTDYGV